MKLTDRDAVLRAFAQCGQTESNLDWLRQQLEPQRDPNLFYPDEELALQKAEAQREYYRRSTPWNADQVDRLVRWLFYEYKQPRPVNLNACRLALSIAAIIKSM